MKTQNTLPSRNKSSVRRKQMKKKQIQMNEFTTRVNAICHIIKILIRMLNMRVIKDFLNNK